MVRPLRLFIVACTCLALVVGASVRVRAIVYGYVDSLNTFSNVGAFIVMASDGRIFPICSGTLIAPAVFLTASHCTIYYELELAPRGFTAFVSFDNPIPWGDLTDRSTNLIPVTEVVTNPAYNQAQDDPGDIAVLILPTRRTKGITPATLPTLGLFDELAAQNGLKNAIFTPVGYGLQNRVVGGGTPFYQDANPVPRMYAFSSFEALNGAFLRLSQNLATGDVAPASGTRVDRTSSMYRASRFWPRLQSPATRCAGRRTWSTGWTSSRRARSCQRT